MNLWKVKLYEAYEIVKMWLADGDSTVIFCRFIATANYLGELLKSYLEKTDTIFFLVYFLNIKTIEKS